MAIPDLASIAVTSLVAFLSMSAFGFPSNVGHACPMARFERAIATAGASAPLVVK